MKPHLKIKYGVWRCSSGSIWLGLGLTPKAAYEGWQKRHTTVEKWSEWLSGLSGWPA